MVSVKLPLHACLNPSTEWILPIRKPVGASRYVNQPRYKGEWRQQTTRLARPDSLRDRHDSRRPRSFVPGVHGSHPGSFHHESLPDVATVEVDQGDVSLVVTETGVLESSVDDVVRCRVESLLGLPVGTPLSGGPPGPSAGRTTRAGASSAVSRSNETALTAVARAMTSAKSRLAKGPAASAIAASSGGMDSRSGGKSAAGSRPPAHPRIQTRPSTFQLPSIATRSAAFILSSSRTLPSVPLCPTRGRWRPLHRRR